ncbi:MAG: hypothetical protein OHK0017_10240 [Patescibacteria group bacterium]
MNPILTTLQVEQYRKHASEHPEQALMILQSIFASASLKLDYEEWKLLNDLISNSGQAGAGFIVNNLNKITFGFGRSNYSEDLAELLISYFPGNAQLIQILLNWQSKLLKEDVILQQVKITSDTELQYWLVFCTNAIRNPDLSDYQVNDFVVKLCYNSPEWLAKFINSLDANVLEKLDLIDLCRYLTENRNGYLLADCYLKLAISDTKPADALNYLYTIFPNQEVEITFNYLRNIKTSRYFFPDDILVNLISKLQNHELNTFFKLADQYWTEEHYPRQVIKAFFNNSKIDYRQLIQSVSSQRFYLSLVDDLGDVVQQWQINGRRFNLYTLLQDIILKDGFSNLDRNYHFSFVQAINPLQNDFELIKIKSLALCYIPLESGLFRDEWLESVMRQPLESDLLRALVSKILNLKQYPFYNVEFIAWMFSQLDEKTFKNLILLNYKQYFNSNHYLEEFYLWLAERDPNNFAYLFTRNKRKLMGNISKYDKSAMQIQITCWRKLSIGQKLRCMLPF